VTRERIFLETMEQVLKNSNKIILDDKQGVVPYLPLNEMLRQNPAQSGAAANRGGNP
jgi:modulator of FtsH protease HflK